MQITRQRVRPEETIETAENCPSCKGSGKITPSILFVDELSNKVNYAFNDLHKKKLMLKVHPYVAAYLIKGLKSIRNKWFMAYYKWVKIEENSSFSFLEYHFYDDNQEELII
jgi:ribonuclease G